jgi:hypothetical protein
MSNVNLLAEAIERILWDEMNARLGKDVPVFASRRIAEAVEGEYTRLRGLADENDGYAKMHAAEVNELRGELTAVLDANTVARDRERYFRWYNEAEDRAQQERFRFAERIAELETEVRRLHTENDRLDSELFEAAVRS